MFNELFLKSYADLAAPLVYDQLYVNKSISSA